MISFYPGPSKLREGVGGYLQEAYTSDILTYNHRNTEFVNVIASTIAALKFKLNIPNTYEIYFVNSATECWQIIAQSLVLERSLHLFNGAFGQRWMDFTQLLGKQTTALTFDIDDYLPQPTAGEHNLICITNCETSNGTFVSTPYIKKLRDANSDSIIAIDATSCMGGVNFDFAQADVWFASVQKCFGLPAGLGIMVCSPRAIARAKEMNSRVYYNSLVRLHEKMQATQTNNTPNMLGIYLLEKVMQESENVIEIETALRNRAANFRNFISKQSELNLLVEDPDLASPTVIAVEGKIELVKQLKSAAKNHDLLLGNGYGAWAENTFRIANFPAHSDADFEKLMKFIKSYFK